MLFDSHHRRPFRSTVGLFLWLQGFIAVYCQIATALILEVICTLASWSTQSQTHEASRELTQDRIEDL